MKDTAWLATYIPGVDSDAKITEELVEIIAMSGTTKADDIFIKLVDVLDKLGVDWTKLVSPMPGYEWSPSNGWKKSRCGKFVEK